MGCDDGHITPYDQYLIMLKTEREETSSKFPDIFGIKKSPASIPYSFMPLGELDVKTLEATKPGCTAFGEQQNVSEGETREIKLPCMKMVQTRNMIVEEMIVNIGSKLR